MALGKVLSRGQVTLLRTIRRLAGVQTGEVPAFQVVEPGWIEVRILPRLRLAEALERYRVGEPIDETPDRARWQEAAAAEVIERVS